MFNPATRLHHILELAYSINDGIKTHEVWSNVLGVANVNESNWFSQYGALLDLVDKYPSYFSSQEERHRGLYLKYYKEIKNVVSPVNLNKIWTETKGLISIEAIDSVALAELALKDNYDEDEIPEDVLDRLTKRINGLITALVKSEIKSDLKEYIIAQLDLAKNALLQYRIHGYSAIQDVVEKSLGGYGFRKNDFSDASDSEPIKEYKSVLGDMINLASIYNTGIKFIENITKTAQYILGT